MGNLHSSSFNEQPSANINSRQASLTLATTLVRIFGSSLVQQSSGPQLRLLRNAILLYELAMSQSNIRRSAIRQSIRRFLIRLLETSLQQYGTKVTFTDHFSDEQLTDWFDAHLNSSPNNLSASQKIVLSLLQRVLGSPNTDGRLMEAVRDRDSSAGGFRLRRMFPKRFVFSHDDTIFMRCHAKDKSCIWAFGNSVRPIDALLEQVKHPGGKDKLALINLVHFYLYNDAAWLFWNVQRTRRYEAVYMLDADRDLLLRRVLGTFPGTRRARRVFLYGPTGTGKSTIPFALAGHLGLKVYQVSINSLHGRRSELPEVLDTLGPCSMLLIDGMIGSEFGDWSRRLSHSDGGDEIPFYEEAEHSRLPLEKEEKRRSFLSNLRAAMRQVSAAVTLTDIFHCLDRMFPPEGQPLVICTCMIDSLSEISFNPQMFDHIVPLSLVCHETAAQIFRYMYSAKMLKLPYTGDEINDMAEQFARQIPENQIYPAAIQDFIYKNVLRPRYAVDNVAAWCVEYMNERGSRSIAEPAQRFRRRPIAEARSDDESDEENESSASEN